MKMYIKTIYNHTMIPANDPKQKCCYNETISICNHRYFDVKLLESLFKQNKSKETIIDKKYNFFNRYVIKNNSDIIFNTNNEKVNEILSQTFIVKQKDIIKIPNDTIVVHIRSGDILSSRPHPGYVPPPLYYYTKLINNHNYNKIIIVSEDTKNPVVKELLKIYSNSTYKKQGLINDIKIILGATHIIMSVGSFVPSLLYMNPYIEKLYSTSSINLKNYYLKNKPWKNTKEQHKLILTYKPDI